MLASVIRAVALALCLAALPWSANAAAARSDEFLTGYLAAILEQELRWSAESYELRVEQGLATLKLKGATPEREAQARARLQRVDGVRAVNITRADARPQTPGFWRGVGEKIGNTLGVSGDTVSFPSGDVFWPLVADEKQPQFFVAARHYDTPLDRTTVGAVAYGETFGLLRVLSTGDDRREGLQFSIAGALFAQFDLEAPSSDLLNADYTIGAQTTYRRGATSGRLRLYHQSSHLGDEFLLRARPTRVNLSFESLELLLARQWNDEHWRAYAGGEYLLRREPEDLKPAMLHIGLEYYGQRVLLLNGHFVAGIDLKSYQENNWAIDRSIKAGLQFGGPGPGGRRVRLLGEVYRGASQHGQFFDQKIDYIGLGLYLGF